MDKRPALGKGLSALIPDAPEPRARADRGRHRSPVAERLSAARSASTTRGCEELARVDQGERRHPADRRAHGSAIGFRSSPASAAGAPPGSPGSLRVPVVVSDVAPGHEQSLLEMALVENIQREDLNPIDEALAYRRLADDFQLKQEDIAAAVGKDRASVANYLRLLKLPDEVRTEVASGRLSMGHARALLSLADGGRAAAHRARRDRPQPVGARNRIAGQETRRRRRAAARDRRRRSRSTCTRAPRKIGSSCSSAPASASSARVRAGASRSISSRKKS